MLKEKLCQVLEIPSIAIRSNKIEEKIEEIISKVFIKFC